MTLADIMQAADKLSQTDRRESIEYLERQERKQLAEEKIRRLNEGFALLREGLSDASLEAITQAMNEEYIEPIDDSEWAT